MKTSSVVCRRRLSALLSLKARLVASSPDDDDDADRAGCNSNASLLEFAKQFLEEKAASSSASWKCHHHHHHHHDEKQNCQSNDSNDGNLMTMKMTMMCGICQEFVDQRRTLFTYVQKQIAAQNEAMKTPRKEDANKQAKITSSTTVSTTTSKEGPVATDTKKAASKISSRSPTKATTHIHHHSHQRHDPKKEEEEKNAVLSEVRSLVQGLKSEALNVSRAVLNSDAKFEQRQNTLANQVQDTEKAAKRADNAEKLMGASSGAGRMADGVIELCKRFMPAMMVESFVRPLVASLFQLLWLGAVVAMFVATVYLMITAPKPR